MRLPLIPVVIDEFGARHDGCNAKVYFLTHFHTDHMKGLTATWNLGMLFCTRITAALLRTHHCRCCHTNATAAAPPTPSHVVVSSKPLHVVNQGCICTRIVELEFETPYLIDLQCGSYQRHFTNQSGAIADGGMRKLGGGPTIVVVFVPARHIPGSAMIIFPDTVVGSILVTGDFKYELPQESAPTGANSSTQQQVVIGAKRSRAERRLQHNNNLRVVVDPMIDSIRFWLGELRPRGGGGDALLPIVDEDYLSSDDGDGDLDDGGHSETNTEDLLMQISGGGGDVPASTTIPTPPALVSDNNNAGTNLPHSNRHNNHHRGTRGVGGTAPPVSPSVILDHMYIDDTWLHLTSTTQSDNPQRPALKSKLLSSAQLVKAFQSLRTTLWFQCRLGVGDGTGRVGGGRTRSQTTKLLPTVTPVVRPFVVRVYIHNNFGKEAVLASLATILGGTTVVVDDTRYALLAALSHIGTDIGAGGANNNINHLEDDDNDTALPPTPTTVPTTTTPPVIQNDDSAPSSDLFVPRSLLATKLSEWQHQLQKHHDHGDTTTTSSIPPGCIEVVTSRSALSEYALAQASKDSAVEVVAAGGGGGEKVVQTRYYGLIMTGWAKSTTRTYPTLGQHQQQQSSSSLPHTASNIFEVPYSLHTSPENLVSFVRALRPRSVSAQHPKECRFAFISSILGPHYYDPYVALSTLEVRGDIPIPMSWRKYVKGAPIRTDEHLHTTTTSTKSKSYHTNTTGQQLIQQQQQHHNDAVYGGTSHGGVGGGCTGVRTNIGKCWTHLSVEGNTPAISQTQLHQPQPSPSINNPYNNVLSGSTPSSPLARMALRNGQSQLLSQVVFAQRRLRVGSRAVTIQPPSTSDNDINDEENITHGTVISTTSIAKAASVNERSSDAPRCKSSSSSPSTGQDVHNQTTTTTTNMEPIHRQMGDVKCITPTTGTVVNDDDDDEEEALSNLLCSPSLWEMAECRW